MGEGRREGKRGGEGGEGKGEEGVGWTPRFLKRGYA